MDGDQDKRLQSLGLRWRELGGSRCSNEVPMTRTVLLEILAMSERNITLGAHRIARQQSLALRAERGQDSSAFEQLLKTFRQVQAIQLALRDKVLAELARPLFTMDRSCRQQA